MWVNVLVMALQAATLATPVKNIPPPLTNGVYVSDTCEGESCSLWGKMQWMRKASIYDRPAPNARRIGALKAGEWAEGVDLQVHRVAVRGVVIDPQTQSAVLAKGDVVYNIHYDGEGFSTLWRSGQSVEWADPTFEPGYALIAWDPKPPDAPATVNWVKVKRASGQTGWVRDLGAVRCSGLQDRDEDCPPLP